MISPPLDEYLTGFGGLLLGELRCQLIEARQCKQLAAGVCDKATEFCWVGLGPASCVTRQQVRVQGVAAERRTRAVRQVFHRGHVRTPSMLW
jgi:hypothetical protein